MNIDRAKYSGSLPRLQKIGCAVAVLFLWLGVANAKVVRFMAEGSGLKGQAVKDRYELVGFVGDFVDLNEGTHEISVDAPQGYTLKFSVNVVGSAVSVVDATTHAPNCQPQLEVNWPPPRVLATNNSGKSVTISIADPQFGAPTGREECSSASMAGCNQRKVILEATSDPAGAEVWINGKKQPFATNVTLSVPFCEYDKSTNVLLRRSDSVNCMRTINLSPDAQVAVNCQLQKP